MRAQAERRGLEAERVKLPDTLKQQVDEVFAKLNAKEQYALSRYVRFMTVRALKEGEKAALEANRRAQGE
jgi:hypothetical protein